MVKSMPRIDLNKITEASQQQIVNAIDFAISRKNPTVISGDLVEDNVTSVQLIDGNIVIKKIS